MIDVRGYLALPTGFGESFNAHATNIRLWQQM
jgi:hypothetical protein